MFCTYVHYSVPPIDLVFIFRCVTSLWQLLFFSLHSTKLSPSYIKTKARNYFFSFPCVLSIKARNLLLWHRNILFLWPLFSFSSACCVAEIRWGGGDDHSLTNITVPPPWVSRSLPGKYLCSPLIGSSLVIDLCARRPKVNLPSNVV